MSDLARYENISAELAFTSEIIAKQLEELKSVSAELNKVDIATIKNAVITYNEAIKSPITSEMNRYINQSLELIKPKLAKLDDTKEKIDKLNNGLNLIYTNSKISAITALLSLLLGCSIGAILSYEWLIKGEKKELNSKLAEIEANYPSINSTYKLLVGKGIKLETAQENNSIYVVVPNQKGEAYTAKNGNLVIKIAEK